MNVAYVEDCPSERNRLVTLVRKCFDAEKIPIGTFDLFSSGLDFLKEWKFGAYELIILDILLYDISGVELTRIIRKTDKNVNIVFCSASNDFASESYDVSACYYICKPVNEQVIYRLIEKLSSRSYDTVESIFLPEGYRLPVRSIMYAAYSNHRISVYTVSGTPVSVRMSFSDFCRMLPADSCFCVCNSGTVINFNHLLKLTSEEAVMKDDARIPVSRRKRSSVADGYKRFLFDSLAQEIT